MSDKPRAVSSHDITLDKEYVQWIHDIKQRFRNAQIRALMQLMVHETVVHFLFVRE